MKKLFYLLIFLSLTACEKKEAIEKKQETAFHTWSAIRQIDELYMVLAGFGIDSMIDIPAKDPDPPLIKELGINDYVGITNSEDMACSLQAKFGDENLNFYRYDITSEILPKKKLILCWDYLYNLKQSDIKSTLFLFKKSGAKYLLMAHDSTIKQNKKNPQEERHPINWTAAPYRLPNPILQISTSQDGEILGLWKVEDIF